jgi:putative transposase
MPLVGDRDDDAMCVSFFAILECELLESQRLRNHGEARAELFRFIDGWYNPVRRRSALAYLSPVAFENRGSSCNARQRLREIA